MGYSHYWSIDMDALRGKTAKYEASYQKAIAECQRVVTRMALVNRELYGTSYLSGYTAHTKPGQYGGINLGGSQDHTAEYLILREHLKQNDSAGAIKTNRHPYDTAVVACLLILSYRLPGIFIVRSDGHEGDWQRVADYVSSVLRRRIHVPETIRTRDESAQSQEA